MENEKRLTWKRSLDGYTDVGLCGGVTVDEAICKLADLEEKNAVEVVRCKDCKKWEKKTRSCEEFTTHRLPAGGRITFLTRENDFCSYGERKGNEV